MLQTAGETGQEQDDYKWQENNNNNNNNNSIYLPTIKLQQS